MEDEHNWNCSCVIEMESCKEFFVRIMAIKRKWTGMVDVKAEVDFNAD